ncbi:hypothetical protein RND81_14G210400 [Saponaria officinalis]|uniref:Vacuolar iron transporter n=1 Tax=Saponaria officinalis TaxID=3572 RepID=A0AAW1GS02_SAPOF
MATEFSSNIIKSPSLNKVTPTNMDLEKAGLEPEGPDYSKRGQWLRAAVLGANDGLLSIASLMVGVGAVKPDVKIMVLTGLAGLFGGACSMAMGEFVSVYSQYDTELAQLLREHQARPGPPGSLEEKKRELPSPFRAAAASAVAFAVGAAVPLLAGAFIKEYRVRLAAVVTMVSVALFGFGWLGAALGKAPPLKSSVRILIGGWLAMGITFGLTKLVGTTGI